ncbi:PDR/VanB family oxidoreductase [Rhodococcus ruber]|uniref:PDR/VanB family oxidoreductase n=1 Tax=Rhodococcus ruber TaxID=1830 RepID=A0ABT4MES3_9NOCA|nr:PDR/VanB family oxidoreductase [Rhodococcus ruber]MCZ4519488.1 PDR/VanB family oxidoreductase [Rhodococcus ruber]
MENLSETFSVQVTKRRTVAEDVVEISLGWSCASPPSWGPGAHIDVILPSGAIRQYSLCNKTGHNEFVIAVLKELGGRGGSLEVHSALVVGTWVHVRGPRNHFVLNPAPSYLFLAGGIGITPIMSMALDASERRIPWSLVYGGRTRSSMAYVEYLTSMADGRVSLVPQDEEGHPDFVTPMQELPPGGLVYACGPEPMLAATEAAASAIFPQGSLHLERFGAKEGGVTVVGDRFDVELARSGCTLTVGPNDRLIDVVRTVAEVPFSCEEGYCGSCETRVVSGTPDHRDQVLNDDEHESNETMMLCVGRSLSRTLVLDL